MSLFLREARSQEEDAQKPEPAAISGVWDLARGHRLFRLRLLDEARNAAFRHTPGQFVMLSVLGAGEAPISVSSSPTRAGAIEVCVRQVGRVTGALFRLRENALVGLRGPYGNGFPMEAMAGGHLLIVAGGLGMAPLRSLLWYVLDRRHEFGRVVLLYGARTPRDILFKDEMTGLTQRSDIQTRLIVESATPSEETGPWNGSVGLITDLVKDLDPEMRSAYVTVCGPPVMYRFVLAELLGRGFDGDRIFVSLERKMRCGIGKCAHCTVGHKYACIHGPVFTYWDTLNLPEMI